MDRAWLGDIVTERKLEAFGEWPLKDLRERERTFPLGHLIGNEIRAEITRREAKQTRCYVLAGVVAAAISAIASMIAAFASLAAIHAR
jgi:hypothetical protein